MAGTKSCKESEKNGIYSTKKLTTHFSPLKRGKEERQVASKKKEKGSKIDRGD